MFTNLAEQKFFLQHLSDHHHVLEYGCGESTSEISKLVKSLISIEHQKLWFDKINSKSLNNCKIILCPPDSDYKEGGHCGTYEQFKTYIYSPIEYGPFDIILIDGRARVECAKLCKQMTHNNSLIFVHDYDRKEYHVINNILNFVNMVGTMAKFTIKL
jgi:protein-L-isoaspartate O-methyltransferase